MKTRFMKFSPTYGLMLVFIVLAVISVTYKNLSAAPHVAASRGISEPPFLSFGVKSNLLLLLDNSGSMLDMAYAGVDGQCFDKSYIDAAQQYAGYYKRDSWYVWRESYFKGAGNVMPYLTERAYPDVLYWENDTTYSNGALVIDNGIFYTASCSGGTATCTSSATAANISEDSGIFWEPATDISSWTAGKTYETGTFVKHKSQVYYLFAPAAGTYLSITDPSTDTAHWQAVDYTWRSGTDYSIGDIVTYNGMIYRAMAASNKSDFDLSDWQRLDEGYFEEVDAAPCVSPSYSHSFTVDGNTITDMQITMAAADGTPVTDVSSQTPAEVTCFAATGNFLNWASASKFDIQKRILTGGKYYPGYEDADIANVTDTGDDRLIAEHRGCAGTGFVKQVTVNNGASDHYLTLRVRGAMGDNPWLVQTDDRVDTTDSTTRIEVLAVSVGGFDVSQCIAAAEDLTDGQGSGATAKDEIEACLNYGGSLSGQENSTNINSLIECTQYWQGNSVNVSNLESHCKGIYDGGTLPSSISPWDPEYICYGVYNPNIPTVEDREGYFGTCWGLAASAGTCTEQATCDYNGGYLNPGGTGLPQKCLGGIEYQCPAQYTYSEASNKCSTSGNNDQGWVELYKNADGYCTYNGGVPVTDAGWVSDPADCTRDAADKFCGQLKVPEVIDPSDKITTTTETYNLPAMLIDAGVMGQLNVSRPLAVLKGYIKQPEKPEGILHSTTEDLRIGAMAFNKVGSATEGSTNPNIERFSPPGNKDGAKVISEIKLGSSVTDDNGTAATTDDRTHVDDLAEAVNAVRAISWTPLAEAMYNAIGYYTQNSQLRINDQVNDEDFPVGADNDPVTNWCQSNNILIITEGASTADVNDDVTSFIEGGTIVKDGDSDSVCGGLAGSTYLDDLTYHAQHAPASVLYPVSQMLSDDGELKDKQNITTYIVATGGLRGDIAGDECNPARIISDAASNGGTSYYDSTSPEELENDLLEIFNSLRQRASSGSAASVISSSRGGEGAIYQGIFFPETKRKNADGTEYTVAWTGDVHALFVDEKGFMFEDTNGDSAMTPSEDTNDNGELNDEEDINGNGSLDLGDKRIIIYFDELSGKSKACYNTVNWTGTCPAGSTAVDLQEVNFIWSAAKWLSDIADVDIAGNRAPYLSNNKQRYIYTWNDLDNDGIVDRDTEWIPFEAATNWSGLTVNTDTEPRNSVPVDFDVVTTIPMLPEVSDAKVDDIVNWIRGKDRLAAVDLNGNALMTDDGEDPLRNRQIPVGEGSAEIITARLGDVIHSTPMVVSTPAEGFHLIYNDFSYAQFAKHYKSRRHVVYFGSNDGMLHAVNGGFYSEQQKKFCTSTAVDGDGNCIDDGTKPALGAELWSYVPYNLIPHLSSLSQPEYSHKYFVDMRPRIFDVQIFPHLEDPDHPNGWGTILVGGMRLGGVPIDASELNGSILQPGDVRQFISSYFIFDITNPEKPPVLLGETTRRLGSGDTDLGHSVAIPTMVIMKKENALSQSADNQWYLIFGSGPHAPVGSNDAMKGLSDQYAKVAVLPLDWLVKTPTALRIPEVAPIASNPGGTIVLNDPEDSPEAFTSDMITIDFDINPNRTSYMADTVYFGTNEGGYGTKVDETTFWAGGGRVYRLMTRNIVSGEYLLGKTIAQEITTPDEWKVTTLMNVEQPVSGAPNVGYDGNNFWVYFGTGRFFDRNDKTDDVQQSFYGIKEPVEATGTAGESKFMATPVSAPTEHPQTTRTYPTFTASPGSKGLLKVDEIRVASARTAALSDLSCRDGGLDCLPPEMVTASKTKFSDLIHYIADPDPIGGDADNLYNSTDGWYIDFYSYANRERNVGQATLFGGLVTFTTYQPYMDVCRAEGVSYLYAPYYQTGTAWHRNVIGLYPNERDVLEKFEIPGPGLSPTPNLHVSGPGDSVTAMLQTSTGEIVEVKQDEVATETYFTGRSGWKECTQ